MIHLYKNTYLTADKRQFIIVDMIDIKEGKMKGQKRQSNSHYFPSIKLLVDHIVQSEIMNSLSNEQIESFEELLRRQEELFKMVESFSKDIGTAYSSSEIVSTDEICKVEKEVKKPKKKKKKLKKLGKIKK